MSTVGVSHFPKIQFTISGWRLLIWLILADLVQIDSPLSQSDSPDRSLWLCLEFVAIGTDPLLDVTGVGMGSALCEDMIVTITWCNPVMEGQNYSFELQTEDMGLAFCMGPSTQNLEIPHMGTPALCRGVHKDCELRLERSDRDSRSEKK